MTLDTPLSQAIMDLLNSASISLTTVSCPDCGSAVEYRNSMFPYEGQTWEIPFPFCPECNPIAHAPMHRA
jgi:hypothetical protein